jgi:hypothetical protein
VSAPEPIHVDRRIDDALLAAILVAGLVAALKFVDYAYDDAYITYRYARNIVEGHGFVYNLEHNFLGTTTPFYTLLLAALGTVLDIPLASGLISVLSLLGGVFVIEQIGRHFGIRCAGSAAGLFLLFEPQVYGIFGGETLFAHMLLLPLGLLLELRGRSRWAAFVFALAILTRMDAGLFVAILYGHLIVRERALPWRRVGVVVLTLAPWFAWSTWVFGSPFPSTLWAKIAQGDSGGWALYIEGSLRALQGLVPYRGPLGIAFGLLALAGTVRIVRREPIWLLFLGNSVLFALAYQFVLGASFSHWYLANALLAHALLLGAGVRAALGPVAVAALRERSSWRDLASGDAVGGRPSAPALIAALLVVLCLGASLVRSARALIAIDTHPPRRLIYTEVGEWLRDNTPESATVSYMEIGYLGYASRRTIIDPVGLVSPGGLEAVARGDFDWVFDAYKPDYYIDNPAHGARSLASQPWFRTRYQLVHRSARRGFTGELLIFERRGGPS